MLQPIYTIYDIASETGASPSQIERWIQYRLVQRSLSSRSDGINYTEDHMRRVGLVKEWMDSQITMRELAERIEILGEKALEVPAPYAGFDGWEDDEDE